MLYIVYLLLDLFGIFFLHIGATQHNFSSCQLTIQQNDQNSAKAPSGGRIDAKDSATAQLWSIRNYLTEVGATSEEVCDCLRCQLLLQAGQTDQQEQHVGQAEHGSSY